MIGEWGVVVVGEWDLDGVQEGVCEDPDLFGVEEIGEWRGGWCGVGLLAAGLEAESFAGKLPGEIAGE